MAGRYLPRIISDSPAVLSEAVRVEVKTNFAQEQTEYVRIMFDEWLAQGERTSEYAQLPLTSLDGSRRGRANSVPRLQPSFRRGVFETISAVAAMRGFQCRILGATTSVVPICEENCEEKDLSLHAARGSEIQDVSVRIPPMPSRHPSCSGVGHTPI